MQGPFCCFFFCGLWLDFFPQGVILDEPQIFRIFKFINADARTASQDLLEVSLLILWTNISSLDFFPILSEKYLIVDSKFVDKISVRS